jgi:hypothetical protein
VTVAGLSSLFSFWLLIPFLAVSNWTHLLALYGLLALGILSAWRSMRTGRTRLSVTLLLMTVIVVSFSRIVSPFILMPVAACAVLTTVCTTAEFHNRLWLVLGWSIVVMIAPFVLEWLGLMNSTYQLVPGVIAIRSDAFEIRGRVDELVLVFTNAFYVATIAVSTYKLNDGRARAQRQLHVQAWHFKQLLPTRRAGSDITRM